MNEAKTRKIDFSNKRFAKIADEFYNNGDYISALRFTKKQYETYGEDCDVLARFSDIYEAMGLQSSAVNSWFRFLHIAEEEDLPDIYEGLAANLLNMGYEGESAYYYNLLVDADESLPADIKLEIADAFESQKPKNIRFVYPPRLADYSKELSIGSKALKNGDCRRAVSELSKIEKGAKEYVSAQEMQAVAHLLMGDAGRAEEVCLALLKDHPHDVRAKATLAAVYLEQGRKDESRALAQSLYKEDLQDTDDVYKVATVCCENEMHEEAYTLFCKLEKQIPYDGRMLYFKGVAAYKCGKLDEAEKTLDTLCTIYPDAEVARYYLLAIRNYREGTGAKPELIYFYHLPQEVREERCKTLLHVSQCPKDEAMIYGLLLLHDRYFEWCFDEMDGADHDLQYLALITANQVRADEFIQQTLLNNEVADILKIESLRMFYERNEDRELGMVFCRIYKKIRLLRIKIGRKRRKRFLQAYAKLASKFVMIRESYGKKLRDAAERLYRALEKYDALDLIDNVDDCACAIFLASGLKELGGNAEEIVRVFDANLDRVRVLLTVMASEESGLDKNGNIEKKNEEN
ncbi:MAG: hypothetical protein J6D30_00310 [Clostridia bacterium]|nr:hypothetical protein [Clostridia bacterium]